MFTEEEKHIISFFYAGDYELAEQLMIATNNVKLVDKLICKIHRVLNTKYRLTKEDMNFWSADTNLNTNYKVSISLQCCSLLVKGFNYRKLDDGRYSQGANEWIKKRKDGYPDCLQSFVYDVGYFDKEKLEIKLKQLGIRLVLQ